MPDGKPSQTIDDTLPRCIVKAKNGEYVGQGRLLQYHAEPGYVFALLANTYGQKFFAIREEPGHMQNEAARADLAYDVCELKRCNTDPALEIAVVGELLPKDFATPFCRFKDMPGIRMRYCLNVSRYEHHSPME